MNPSDHVPSRDRSPRTLGVALLLCAVLVHLAAVLAPRGGELLDGHSFRQLQTALTAQAFQLHGFKLAYETPVLGPPWSIPLEFPIYPATVAAVSSLSGLPLELCGPAVSLAFFYLAVLGGAQLLARLGFSPSVRLLWVALALTSPIYAIYARHFMIETTAVALGMWFLYLLHRSLTGSAAWWGPTVVIGALAAVSKSTTFLPFGFAAVLLTLHTVRRLERRPGLRRLACAALAAVPIATAALVWLRYSDALKAQNPIGSFLTSSNLQEFNFGSLAQRFSPAFWGRIFDRITASASAEATLFVGLPLLWLASPAARRWAWAALAAFSLPVLVFSNLYFVHDYYFMANGLFLLAAIAIGLDALVARADWPIAVRGGIVALALLAQVTTAWRTYGVNFTRPPVAPPALAPLIAAATEPDDVILAFGYDWNSALPYYSQRRAIMLPRNFEHRRDLISRSLQLLEGARVGALVIANEFRERDLFARPYAEQLDLAFTPVAANAEAKIYLRRDLMASARQRLGKFARDGWELQLDYDAAAVAAEAERTRGEDLTRERWHGRLAMASPAPFRLRGEFEMNLADLDGQRVLGIHAPTDLLFRPPPGARRINAVVGMVPAAYLGRDHTDGTVAELWQEFPNGEKQLLARRALRPVTQAEDRGDQTLEFSAASAFSGLIVLRFSPGPEGNVNYDWCYVRSISIE